VIFSDLASRFRATILVLKQPASQATIGQHLRVLEAEFGSLDLGELDYVRLQKFFSGFSKTRSPKTVHNLWSSLRLVLNQAKREGLLQAVPDIQLPKCRRQTQPWFTEDQMRELVKRGKEDQRLFGLLAETGLRIGEALAVRFSDIDFRGKTLTVNLSMYRGQEQQPKTDAALRTICISSRLRDLLAAPGEGTLFPVGSTTVLQRLHKAEDMAGIEHCGFHAFRRGNASLLQNKLAMPEPILARRLGHELRSLTAGVYNYGAKFEDRPWAEKIGRLLLP
jgi:integrase